MRNKVTRILFSVKPRSFKPGSIPFWIRLISNLNPSHRDNIHSFFSCFSIRCTKKGVRQKQMSNYGASPPNYFSGKTFQLATCVQG